MGQSSKVLLAIDICTHTVPQRTLDCKPGLGNICFATIAGGMIQLSIANRFQGFGSHLGL